MELQRVSGTIESGEHGNYHGGKGKPTLPFVVLVGVNEDCVVGTNCHSWLLGDCISTMKRLINTQPAAT